jgi:hypothetical protein
VSIVQGARGVESTKDRSGPARSVRNRRRRPRLIEIVQLCHQQDCLWIHSRAHHCFIIRILPRADSLIRIRAAAGQRLPVMCHQQHCLWIHSRANRYFVIRILPRADSLIRIRAAAGHPNTISDYLLCECESTLISCSV